MHTIHIVIHSDRSKTLILLHFHFLKDLRDRKFCETGNFWVRRMKRKILTTIQTVRVAVIETASQSWQDRVLPLNHTRIIFNKIIQAESYPLDELNSIIFPSDCNISDAIKQLPLERPALYNLCFIEILLGKT